MDLYVVAGFGCGNLGDDAIFNGIKNSYKYNKITQLYVNHPSSLPATQMHSIIHNGFHKNAVGKLIIGGGNLFHATNAIQDCLSLAKRARESNLDVEIQGCGAEYATEKDRALIIEFCGLASYLSVRSEKSRQILEALGIKVNCVQKDFAYGLLPDIPAAETIMPIYLNEFPIIGLVIGTSPLLPFMRKIVKQITELDYNVLLIPHVRHYIGKESNEVALNELLWSSIDNYLYDRIEKVRCLPFPKTPEALLGVYYLIDGIIGSRFHSFVMSDISCRPLLGVVSCAKAQAFFDEHLEYDFIKIDDDNEQKKTWKLANFLERVDSYANQRRSE